MLNNNEIDASQVVPDPVEINPEQVIPDRETYSMRREDRKKVYHSFSGDPLAFISDPDEKMYVRSLTESFPDRDEYRKRMALAAYFTVENRGSDYRFNLANLDGILEKFYKKKTSVEAAYSDLAKLYAPEEVSVAKEFGKVLAEGAKKHFAAFSSGLVDLDANMAAAFLKFGIWNLNIQEKVLSPILPENTKNFLKLYKAMVEFYGKEIRKSQKQIGKELAQESNINSDFLLDLFSGDFEKVSTSDFTKALIQSSPNMAFQIGLAAISPWALPAFIGAEQSALKAYEVEEKQPDWGTLKKWGYISLSAANEALFEYVTSRIVGGKMSKDAAGKVIQKGLLKFMGESFVKEGSSEGAQQLLANINDLLFDLEGDLHRLNNAELFRRTFTGVLESASIGGVWGVPEGVAGFHSAREAMGNVQQIRQKQQKILKELTGKEELSPEENQKLAHARNVLQSEDPREIAALEYLNNVIEEANQEEEIRSSEEYRETAEMAAEGTSEEVLVKAVKAERNNNLRKTAQHDPEDVADLVQQYSVNFQGTVFNVVENWDELPQYSIDARGRAFVDLSSGEVYINSSRVRPHEVLPVMLHEVIGHKGVRSVVKEDLWNDMLDDIYERHGEERDFIEAVKAYFPEENRVTLTDDDGLEYESISLSTVKEQRLAAEEYIAHLAEKGVLKPSWWKEFLQKIRMALAGIFGEEFPMTNREIETLLARAARKVRNSAVVKENLTTEMGELRYSIIGEEGAAKLDRYAGQNNLAKLAIAKTMLDSGKDAKTIKQATGWEKGGDGKWRMEVPDLQFIGAEVLSRDLNNVTGFLEDIINAPELFAAYPKLKNMLVRTVMEHEDILPESVGGRYDGEKILINAKATALTSYEKEQLRIAREAIEDSWNLSAEEIAMRKELEMELDPEKIRKNAYKRIQQLEELQLLKFRDILIHEIQHAIQDIEGFARGGSISVDKNISPEFAHKARAGSLRKHLADAGFDVSMEEAMLLTDENGNDTEAENIWNKLVDMGMTEEQYDLIFSKVPLFIGYNNLVGEVEARNATQRSRMSSGEKRQSLLAETADVAEESQIYIFDGDGKSQFARGNLKDIENLKIYAQMLGVPENHIVFKILSHKGYISNGSNKVYLESNGVLSGLGKHILEIGKATRGGIYFQEFIDNFEKAFNGKRRFDKKNMEGFYVFLDADNKPLYTFRTYEKNGKEYFESFYGHERGEKKTKKIVEGLQTSHRLLSDLVRINPQQSSNISQNFENASGEKRNNTEKYEKVRNGTGEVRFSIADYSEEEQQDYIDILRPFVGTDINMRENLYRNYLKEKGVHIPDEDADAFFRMAVRENKNEALRSGMKRRREEAYNYWMESNPLVKFIVEFTGSTDFTIKPTGFEGEDFTGSFISPEYVKYSEKKPQGKRSDKQYRIYLARRKEALDSASGHAIDELAEQYSRKTGLDYNEVLEEIKETFRHLKRKDIFADYKKFRDENFARTEQEAAEAAEAFADYERQRVEDEVIDILTNGRTLDPDWISANRDVYKELYHRIFHREAPYQISKRDLETLNSAITQSSGDAATYAEAYKAARIQTQNEFRTRLQKIREDLTQSKADAIRLQRDAIEFAEQHLDRESRSDFIRKIMNLLEYSTNPSAKYPEGRRKHEFESLLESMKNASSAKTKKYYLDKIAKRLNELGERTDSTRKVRGVRDMATQEKLNRIIAITRMDGGALNAALEQDQNSMENLLSAGESTLAMEEDILFLQTYGELWNKSAVEIRQAYDELQLLARTGKNNLLRQIERRAAEDENDRNELWNAINGKKRYSATELQKLENKRAKSPRRKILENSFWETLSLDGILEAVAFFSSDKNLVNTFRRMAHDSWQKKQSMNRHNAEDFRDFMKKILHTKSNIVLADTIGKWREVKQSGVKRFIPDPNAKQFTFSRIPVEEARQKLAAYDSGSMNMPDYEAEAIRQQIVTLDRKVKYEVPEEFRDGATDRLIQLIRQETEPDKEPVIVIPIPTYQGEMQELELSQMQALYLRLMWDQKNIRYKMHYNGYTEETMEQIDSFLRPEVKKFGNWMREQLEKDRTAISEVYKEMYFAAFPKEENYFPSVYNVSGNRVKTSSVDLTQEGSASGAIAYTPGALKVRVYHLKDLKVADALTVFQNHRLQMNHFVSHANSARKMRSVLLNGDIKQAIEAEHGLAAYRELKTALQDFINGGNADVLVNDIGAHLYSNAVRAKMAFNLVSSLKQTLGFLSFVQEVPAWELLKGMKYAAAHPKEVLETLGNTEYFRNRWNSGANAELRLLLDSAGINGTKFKEVINRVDELGSLPLRLGDAFSVLTGGYAVYKYHYDSMIRQGIPPAEAKEEALARWEMAAERTQQTNSPFLLNRFQRGGYMYRLFTTFMSNQILLWNNNASSIYKGLHYGKKAPLSKAKSGIMALVLSGAAMAAFDQIKEHWNDGEYAWMDLFWNILADSVTGFGPAGSVASEAIQALKPDGYQSTKIWSSDLSYAMRVLKRQMTEDDAKLSDKDWRDAVQILQAAGYVYPAAAQAGAVAREARKWKRIITE